MEKTNFLKRESKSEWFLCLLLGFFIGLAVVAPGISGATIAIIFGLYTKLLYSFENIFKEFKKCFIFLLPIGIGMVLGFGFGFLVIQKLFEIIPFIVICLFAGLMIGSFPAVTDEVKGMKWNGCKIALFIVGIIVPIAIGVASIFLSNNSSQPIDANILLIVLYFCMGFFVSITQLLPGLSCSALLMAFGQFSAIMASVHLDYLLDNPLVIVALCSLAIGFVFGIIMFSKLINKLLDKKRDATFSAIVGLSLGSIFSMFLNPESWSVYTSWNSAKEVVVDLAIGLPLLAVGVVLTYLLVRYQRKKNTEKLAEDSAVFKPSKTEEMGLKVLSENAKAILSVGISTGGSAEIEMAKKCKDAKIIATTIDKKGLEFTKNIIKEQGFEDRIDAKLEDVSQPFEYKNESFDFVYARLVLHYLTKQQLSSTLDEINRTMKKGGKFYVVTRSNDEWELKRPNAIASFDKETNMTEYYAQQLNGKTEKRQFLSKDQLVEVLKSHGFKIISAKNVREYLYIDYERTKKSEHPNYLVEVVAEKLD